MEKKDQDAMVDRTNGLVTYTEQISVERAEELFQGRLVEFEKELLAQIVSQQEGGPFDGQQYADTLTNVSNLRGQILGAYREAYLHQLHAVQGYHELLEMTKQLAEHPDGYDGPCNCQTCMAYAEEGADD